MKVLEGSLPKGAEITSFLGSYTLNIPEGFLKSRKIPLKEHLVAVEQITEENKYSVLGKAGWGTLGAIALGPVGLLAGIVLGGNSKELCCACKLDSGEEFLVTCDTEECQKLKKISIAPKDTSFEGETIEAEAEAVERQDILNAIERLGKLREQGVVTDEEFNAKKAELLAKL